MTESILVDDGLERWQVHPDDAFYQDALKLEPDKDGIRHTTPEAIEATQTWWWRDAVKKADKLVEELAIPWDNLALDETDITDGNTMLLTEKLSKTSFYIVQTNNKLAHLLAIQSASKEAMDHAVNRIIARGDDIDGVSPKPSIDARRASIISRDKRLRNTKIEAIESSAAIKALESVKDSLDITWKTISRILSARFHEPIDR